MGNKDGLCSKYKESVKVQSVQVISPDSRSYFSVSSLEFMVWCFILIYGSFVSIFCHSICEVIFVLK